MKRAELPAQLLGEELHELLDRHIKACEDRRGATGSTDPFCLPSVHTFERFVTFFAFKPI